MLDKKIYTAFSEENLLESYKAYKLARTDLFDNTKVLIPMGADGIEYEDFEKELTKNIRGISRRILSSKYIFYPLIETHRKKPNGGIRVLSVSSIRDAIVQRQIYEIIYPELEKLFSRDPVNYLSFAYRKKFSAPRAITHVKYNIDHGYIYALDADLTKYFDTIDHDILKAKLAAYLLNNKEILKILYRFIASDRVPVNTYSKRVKNKKSGLKVFKVIKPKRIKREKGIPQGGMLSGLLANFYLSEFDWWVANVLNREHEVRYIRYADDFLLMAKNSDDLTIVQVKVAEKMAEINLELNSSKTKIIDIHKSGITFLGFHVDRNSIGVSQINVERYKDRIEKILASIEIEKYIYFDEIKIVRIIVNRLNFKVTGVPEEHCQSCGKSKSGRPRSWISFFSTIDDIQGLKKIDKWLRQRLYRFFFKNFNIKIDRRILKGANILSLEREYYRIKHIKNCKCDLSVDSEVDPDINHLTL